jgi:thioredoxin-related protein
MTTQDQYAPEDARRRSPVRSFAILALAAFASVALWQRFSHAKSAVDWQDDLPGALARAVDTGRPVLISFSSPGCMYCRRMEAEVIPQEAVLAEIDKFIPVKIDAWSKRAISERYRVGSLPCYVVVDSDGQPVAMRDGFIPEGEFIRFLQYAGRALAE